MESRKLIQFGKSSLIVSMPRTWIDRNKLNKGDEVYLDVKSDELCIYPKKLSHAEQPKEITIIVTDKDSRMLEREIKTAYINNCNIITFVGDDIKLKTKEIRTIIQDLIAIEIMEQTPTKIVARDFLNMSQLSIEGLIRKMDIVIRDMMSDVKKVTKQEHYDNVVHQDDDVNRLSYLAFRVIRSALKNPLLAKSMEMDELTLLDSYRLGEYLEKIADECKRIARFLVNVKLPEKEKEDLLMIFTKLEKIYFEAMKSYYTKNTDSAFKYAATKKQILDDCDVFLNKHINTPLVPNIIEKMKNMNSYIHHILRVAYNRHV